MITEYIFGKVADDGIKKIKEWTNKDKAQRILLKCFKDCHKNNKEIILVDEKAILSIDSNKLQPNHRPDDVVKDIKEVCEKCILTDDSYKRKAIEIEIVYNYLKEANKDLLKLCHVDEDIHSVKDEILENRKILIKQHSDLRVESLYH